MQAVILAGGRGTRLYPLTSLIAKPMVPLFGRPVMEHMIRRLERCGFRDIGVTLSHLAQDVVSYFGGGSRWGVHLQYSVEDAPLGTAGSVKLIQRSLADTFLVVCGDGVTDIDLRAAFRYHKRKRAKVTIILHRVPDPSPFGVVQTARDGRIVSFVEKPPSAAAVGNTVNTGMYIVEPEVLDLVPDGEMFDFARHLFPKLLVRGESFYGYRPRGYWCDVGNLGQYRDVHYDALSGRLNLEVPARQIAARGWMGPGVEIASSARLAEPFYIGEGARVGRDACVGMYSIVGERSVVEDGATVQASILWPSSQVGRNARVQGCIVGGGNVIDAGAALCDTAVIRDNGSASLRAAIGSAVSGLLGGAVNWFTWSDLVSVERRGQAA
jgi:mannose-1-phosphate guanylyltransferase/phosphomannomutase